MPACASRLHQLHGQLRLGPEPRIPLAARQPRRRRVGHRVHRPIDPLVGPQAGHRDDAVVDLAHRAQVLAGHMGGGGAVLAVAGVVQHQHAPVIGGGGRVLAQQPHPPVVDHLVVPGRFRKEPLQPLDLAVLGPGDRLGPGQPGQGLVAVPGQQQALQVVTEPTALGHACQQRVELRWRSPPAGPARAGTDDGSSSAVVGSWWRTGPWTGPPKPTPASTNYRYRVLGDGLTRRWSTEADHPARGAYSVDAPARRG